jgi:hypothetical protein
MMGFSNGFRSYTVYRSIVTILRARSRPHVGPSIDEAHVRRLLNWALHQLT